VGEERSIYRIFVGTYERMRQVGRPTYRWENNVKMNLTGVGW
jgi:hypothetical protein